MKRTRLGFVVVCLVAVLFISGCGLFQKGNVVQVQKTPAGYELLVNGQPFYIQGVGLGEAYGKKGENYLAMAKELGANTVRTWGTDQGTKKYLDEAHRQGLYVFAGIWIRGADAKKGISYLSGNEMREKEKEALAYVKRFKNHPSIIAWNIGNECIFFTKDEAERAALCQFIERLNKKVKALDPNHPVVYASVNSLDLASLKKHVPSLDIIGMNIYGSVIASQSGWERQEFDRPYVVTEFGPLGPWDLPKDGFGKMIEPSDYSKAAFYKNLWSLIRERRGKNIGGFVFHLGETSQESMTMWNINDHTYIREPFVVMQKLFGAGDGSDHAPRIASFTGVPHQAAPGQKFEVELKASDPEGTELSYEYKASTSAQDILQYYVNGDVPITVEGQGPRVTLTAPEHPGIYRFYGFARDQTGHSSSANTTMEVGIFASADL